MAFWANLFGRGGKSASADEAKAVELDAALMAAINGGWGMKTRSGQQVSLNSSLMTTAFYRGVLSLAEGVAQLPVEIHRYLPSGKGTEPAIDHALYDVLRGRANNLQDSYQFWRTMLMHTVATGNGVAYKNVVNGETRELLPIRPECVNIDIESMFYTRTYDLTFEKGPFARVGQSEVFHLQGPSWTPYKGLDPSIVGREALGLAQATEESHARLHENGTRPSGVLHTTQKLTESQVKTLRELWRQSFAGTSKIGETPVLSGGLEWTPMSMKGVDSEHLATRKHQIEEIARLLGIFPIMLGHAGDQSPTFASADAFLEAHVRYALQPLFRTVIMAIETQLLTKDERREGYHARIDSSELLRGSLEARTNYYKAALGNNSQPGWLKPNEIREDDGWNQVEEPEMDKVWQPATMAPVGTPPEPKPEAKSSAPRTLYLSRKLLNGDELLAWAAKQGFKNTLKASDLHVTVAYSRRPIDWMEVGDTWTGDSKGNLVVRAGGPRVVERMGDEGPIALLFASSELAWRNGSIRDTGASWDWPDYQPHVTITYDAEGVDLSKVEPFRGELRFGPEIFAEIDPSWTPEK